MKAIDIITQAEADSRTARDAIGALVYHNQCKVLDAFKKHRIEPRHFAATNGYGYGDLGRDTLDELFATVFGAQKALVRPQLVSGTHALSVCLFALARPGKAILSITGDPYDTLLDTIGTENEAEYVFSLKKLGATFISLPLLADGNIDIDGMTDILHQRDDINLVYLQRSRGYAWRPAILNTQIKVACAALKALRPDVPVMLDNCYGEFTETQEPIQAGVDIISGSLIKNPGGGLAPTGGYIAGTEKLINTVQYRMTAPGIGAEVGSWQGGYQPFYQGLFMAPHVVGESLKGAILAARAFELMGYATMPSFDAPRADIVQAIEFGKKEPLLAFCKEIQSASPVDSHLTPEPWAMPGYQHEVIMAAGAFVQGSSIELSADAPIKPPFIGYLQGGLTYEHCKYAITKVIEALG